MNPILALSAFAWGLAEATFFFIVPDVLLTMVASRDRTAALRCSALAVAGALVGGLAMYRWGASDPAAARAAVELVPAVSPEMMARVHSDMLDSGGTALLLGPLSGTPYKTYAVTAASTGMGLTAFLLISFVARAWRFVLLVVATGWVSERLAPTMSLGARRAALAAAWAAFYTAYFLKMW